MIKIEYAKVKYLLAKHRIFLGFIKSNFYSLMNIKNIDNNENLWGGGI